MKNVLCSISCALFGLLWMIDTNAFAVSSLTEKEQLVVCHVMKSIEEAENFQSKVNADILQIPGMSGYKTRHFLNNLCAFPKTVYLEIGCWKGSTLISALYQNNPTIRDAIAIENWSEFGSPRNEFLYNISHFLPSTSLRTIEMDCFQVPCKQSFPLPVTIYFYDGNHDVSSQEKAFTYFNEIFDDVFVAVVDDWNWSHVKDGTSSAFRKLGYQILFEKEIFTNANGDPIGWWNGLYIAVIRK